MYKIREFKMFQIKPGSAFYNFFSNQIDFLNVLWIFQRVWHGKAFSIWEIWTHSNVYIEIDYSFVIEKETNEKSFDCEWRPIDASIFGFTFIFIIYSIRLPFSETLTQNIYRFKFIGYGLSLNIRGLCAYVYFNFN